MKKRTRKISVQDLSRFKARVRRHVPSEAWVDAVVHDHQPYPPPADTPNCQMRPCNSETCRGRLYPSYYVNGTTCWECHLNNLSPYQLENLPRSNSILRG